MELSDIIGEICGIPLDPGTAPRAPIRHPLGRHTERGKDVHQRAVGGRSGGNSHKIRHLAAGIVFSDIVFDRVLLRASVVERDETAGVACLAGFIIRREQRVVISEPYMSAVAAITAVDPPALDKRTVANGIFFENGCPLCSKFRSRHPFRRVGLGKIP